MTRKEVGVWLGVGSDQRQIGRMLSFPFAELTTPPFRIEAQWTLAELLGYFSSWSATNRYIRTNGHNPLKPLAKQLAQAWGDVDTPRLVT